MQAFIQTYGTVSWLYHSLFTLVKGTLLHLHLLTIPTRTTAQESSIAQDVDLERNIELGEDGDSPQPEPKPGNKRET